MGNRRIIRLTNAFSNEGREPCPRDGLLYFMHYNFVQAFTRPFGVTPAMAAGVTGRLWELGDLVAVLEEWEDSQSGDSK